ncbi:MAG: peptidyl-prolyl cis-trans isomerase [Candidatus Korobacteraceae bacterium]
MLKFLQKEGPVKKYVLGGILVFICLAMSAYLIPGGFGDYFTGTVTQAGVLAVVGDQSVGLQEVAQRARMIGRQQFRGNIPDSLMPFLMQRAADSMITQGAMVYEADRMGLGVSNEEVRSYLHQGQLGEVFFPGGNFIGDEAYEQFVQNQFGLSVVEFERELKAQIASQKLLAAVGAPATVSDKQIKEQVDKDQTKVKFDYAIITLDDIKKNIHPTDAELKAFYDQNKQEYVNSIPEKRKARYIIVDRAKIADNIEISQADLQQYYSQHQDEFRVPETVTVRHILIKTPVPGADGKVDQKGVDAAKAKAEDIEKQLKNGADFATLAKQYSEDPGSAQNGGLLPPLTRGRTVPEFEQAAFNTPVGQTTGLIRTSYGFHIIRVEGKQSPRMKPLDEVKGQIEPALKQQKAAAEAQRLADTVQSLARTNGMDKAAADKSLTVTTTDFLSKTDQFPGVGNSQDLMGDVFSAKKMDPPATASIPQGYAIYQVTDVEPPQTPAFDQIKAKVEDQFKTQRAQQMLAQRTQELADRAHSEHDLNKAAKELNATVKTSDLVGPTSQVPDIGSLTGSAAQIFILKPGEISGPIGLQASGVVVMLTEKQEPSPEELKKNWDAAKDQLLSQKRQELEGLYVQNLRERLEKEGKIKINKKEMDRLARNES